MKKLLLISCLLLCVVLSLSACARNYKTADVFADTDNSSNAFTKSTAISALDGAYWQTSIGHVSLFQHSDGYNSYIVYDMAEKRVVSNFRDADNVKLMSISGTPLILVYENEQTKLYSIKGSHVASADGTVDTYNISSNLNLFRFDNKIYRVEEDGSVVHVGNPMFIPSITTFTKTVAGYYYDINSGSVYVYDSNLNLVASWENTSLSAESNCMVLANGNVIVQTLEPLPSDAKKYTLVADGVKYELTSYVINPKNGKVKTVKLDYVITEVIHNSDGIYGYDINEKIQNIALIIPIENQAPLNEAGARIVSLNKNGRINGNLFSDLKNYHAGDILPINDELFAYESSAGFIGLVDKSGKLVTTLNTLGDHRNQHHTIISDIIYNWDFTTTYDLESHDMTYVATMENCIILEKSGTYYHYDANGTVYDINTSSKVTLGNDYYIVENTSGKYDLYNDLGQRIASYNSKPSLVTYDTDGNYIFRVSDSGIYKYYILTK